MPEMLQEYRERLALSISMARSALDATPPGTDADRAFSVLAAACKTAEFLGLRAVIPPAHALESARSAAGTRVANWDAANRARVLSALDGLELALATLGPAIENVPTQSETPSLREFEALAHNATSAGATHASHAEEPLDPPSSEDADEPSPSAPPLSPDNPRAIPEVVGLPVDQIKIGDRLRQADPGTVGALADSIATIGLCAPITVVLKSEGEWVLVAGLQRLNAVKKLGWEYVPALIIKPEGITTELWKIDENLIRSELTRLERDQHLLRRKELFDAARAAETGRSAPSSGGRGKTGFAHDTENQLGLSKRSVNEAVHRASRIPVVLQDRLRGLAAANSASELNALARLDPKLQAEAVERVRAGRAETLRQASAQLRGKPGERDPSEFQFQRLVLAWNNAQPEIRDRFLNWLVSTGALHDAGEAAIGDEIRPVLRTGITPTN